MKRLLIIAALLISAYSFGQTIPGYTNINDRYNWLAGYLRSLNIPVGTTPTLQSGQTHQAGALFYDSTGVDSGLYIYSKAFQRMARASELTDSAGNKLTRVYRSNDSVYYCIYNTCTFAYIDSSGGGGISDTSHLIGLRYGYDWSTNPLTGWTDNTPATSITTGSGHTIFSGGSFAAGNNIAQSFYIGSENWTVEQDVVCGTINNTSYGFSFNLSGSVGGTASLGGYFLLSDTMKRVAYTATGLVPTYSDLNSRTTSNFIVSTGDTLHVKMQRKDKIVTTTMINKANGVSASVSADDQYCTAAQFSIGFYGGTWTFIDSLKITYQDIKYPQVAVIGNSIASSATADNSSTDWFRIATEGVTGGVVHMGAGFEQFLQGTYRMDDIVNYVKPHILFIEYPENDLINSVNIDSTKARALRIIVPAKAAGITPVLIGVVPNQTNGTTLNDTLRSIALQQNIEFVDVFTAMKAPSATTINSIYGPGGGDPHPNQNGHTLMGRMVKDQVSYLWNTTSAFNFKPLPTIIAPKFYMAQDENGNIGKAYNSFQSDYIRNKYINNIIEDAQSASLAINGRAVFTGIGTAGISDLVVVGNSGSLSNPNFKVSAGTTTATTLSAGTFSSGNFSVSTNPAIAGGNFIWSANAVNMMFSPFAVMVSNPAGNGITTGMYIDNNTTNYGSSTDKLLDFRKSGTSVASFYRDGDFRTTKASGYTNNINGTLSTNDWVTKGYADSIVSGAGGTNIYNTNGSLTGNRTLTGASHDLTMTGLGTWSVDATGMLLNSGSDLVLQFDSLYFNALPKNNDTTGWKMMKYNPGTNSVAWGNYTGGGGTTYTFSTGLNESAGTVTNKLSTGVSGGQSVIGGTAANDLLTINGNNSASSNTATNPNIKIGVGNSGSTVAGQIHNNGVWALGTVANSDASTYRLVIQQLDNTANDGIIIYPNANTATNMMIGYGNIICNSSDFRISATGGPIKLNSSNGIYLGGVGTPNSTAQVAGSLSAAYVAKTGNYTLTISDYAVEVTSGTNQQTLPTAVGIPGRIYFVTNSGSGTVTVGTTSSQTFVNVSGTPTTRSLAQFKGEYYMSNGANWLLLSTF